MNNVGDVGIGTTSPNQSYPLENPRHHRNRRHPTYYSSSGWRPGSRHHHTLPTAAPASNGYVLSATTGGVMVVVAGAGRYTTGTQTYNKTHRSGDFHDSNTGVNAADRNRHPVGRATTDTLRINPSMARPIRSPASRWHSVSGTLAVGSGGTGATSFNNNEFFSNRHLPLPRLRWAADSVLRVPGERRTSLALSI
jgi:hypothetical protein